MPLTMLSSQSYCGGGRSTCEAAALLSRCARCGPPMQLYRPLPGPLMPGVDPHTHLGCITGFKGTTKRCLALALLACMGMSVTKSLTPGVNTHLVAHDVYENSLKMNAARWVSTWFTLGLHLDYTWFTLGKAGAGVCRAGLETWRADSSRVASCAAVLLAPGWLAQASSCA